MIQLSNDPAVSVSYLYSGLFETQEEWSHPHRVIDSYEIRQRARWPARQWTPC